MAQQEKLMDATEHTCLANAERPRTLILPLTEDEYQRLSTWGPCTRVRIVDVDDGTARLEIDTRLLCAGCKGTGQFAPEPGIDMQCRYCQGTGLR